jgi:hypothetical protein
MSSFVNAVHFEISLFINMVQCLFAGVFAPSGAGNLNVPSFYEEIWEVVLKGPVGVDHWDISVRWTIGNETAMVTIPGGHIYFKVGDLGTFQNVDGSRLTTCGVLQAFINSLDRIYAFVDSDAWDNVSSINVGAIRENASGTYVQSSGKLSLEPYFPSTNPILTVSPTYQSLAYDVTLAHELQHAADSNQGLTTNQMEQNAYQNASQYIKIAYLLDNDPYNKIIYRTAWEENKLIFVENYGGDPADMIWPPD